MLSSKIIKKAKFIKYIFLLVIFTCLNPFKLNQAIAQKSIPEEEITNLKIQPRLGIKFTTGEGLGYEGSFTTLEGFIPVFQKPGKSVTFLNSKLLFTTEDSLLNGNIVLGHRFYSQKDKRIIGTYLAFDSRKTIENNFDQIGAGIESLGEKWDARANFYVPINNSRQLADESINQTVSPLSLPSFQNNFLVQNQTVQRQINRRFEAAMTGFDLEFGAKLTSLGKTGNVRGYAGLYYYDATGSSNIIGGKGRLEIYPTSNLKLGLLLSSDRNFGTNLAVSVGASLGDTPAKNTDSQQKQLIGRLGESVLRNENIVIDSQTESESTSETQTVTLTDPTTSQPLTFQHVDISGNSGDGSFESPFNDINQALNNAQNNDIIYVRGNNNSQISGFTIPNDIQVVSSGVQQNVNTTESGIVQLPGSGTGTLPTINGTVTMSDRSKIAGFNIVSNNGSGIFANNVSNLTIENNNITSLTDRAINLTFNSGSDGMINITNNQITNSGTSANQNPTGLFDGISIAISNGVNRSFNITGNNISNNQGNGINISLQDQARANITVDNNQINQNQLSGINTSTSDNSNLDLNVSNSSLDQNQIRGISTLSSDNSTGNINIDSNIITNNQSEGINILVNDLSNIVVSIVNNSGVSNKINTNLNGIAVSANNDAQLRLIIDSNTISSNTSTGTIIQGFGDSTIFTSLNSNAFTANNILDLEIITFDNSTICSRFSDNSINNLSINGILGGTLQIEENSLNNNFITTNNVSGTTNVPVGTCGF